MITPTDKHRPARLHAVSSLETGSAQPDPSLREGRAGGFYKFATMLAVAFILGVVFYGLNAQRPDGVQTAAAPGASTTAPTGANPAADATTGQGGVQTTGQATPVKDGSGAGVTNEGSGGQPQPSPQDAAQQERPATQAPSNPR
jgi:hypothetical protein